MPRRPATQADIARATGLNQTTVSRVLREGGPVSDETRRKVLAAAKRLGYRPSALGRAMRSGRSGLIGMIESTVSSKSAPLRGTMDGVHAALEEAGLTLTAFRIPDEKLTSDAHVPRMLSELLIDGLLIHYMTLFPENMEEMIDGLPVPSVWMNVKRARGAVYPDDRAAAVEATEYLLSLGHRRIAYADFGNNLEAPARMLHYSAHDRLAGYKAAMRRAGARAAVVAPAVRGDNAACMRLVGEALSGAKRPTAFVVYGPREALLIQHVAACAGLSMPRDLSLILFEDTARGMLGIPWTTMMIPSEEMGRRSVRMLAGRIERARRSPASVALPFGFIEGASCAPPSEGGA